MKKALIVTTVSGFVPQFEMDNVRLLQSMGFQIHYATNYHNPVYGEDNKRLEHTGIIKKHVNFVREPWKVLKHWQAYIHLKRIMEKERYQMVHCHTPMGGVIGRLAAKNTNTKPVIYTVHGFHFYKGSSLRRWIVIYFVERFLAKYTDVLVTINKEDDRIARKFMVRENGMVENIRGIGMNTNRQVPLFEREKKRRDLGVSENAFLLTSVGELSVRKNHQIILKAISQLKYENIIYYICGKGSEEDKLKKIAKKFGLERRVIFGGYRKDVDEILSVSDVFLFPSKQEGLPVALLESMIWGLPSICSKIRGNVDLIVQGQGGYLVDWDDYMGFARAIEELYLDPIQRKKFGSFNTTVAKRFDRKKIEKVMKKIYQRCDGANEEKVC